MDTNLLSPNAQLYTTLGAMLFAVTVAGVLAAIVLRRLRAIQLQFGGKPISLLRYVIADSRAQMKHPHEFARELDRLLDEDKLAIDMGLPMAPRTARLVAEREISTDVNLRKNENKYATMYKLARSLLIDEEPSSTDLTGLALVGSVAPAEQSSEDAEKREDAV